MKPYFDYSDIENPVKYHLDESYYMTLQFNAAYIMNMYVRKNEYTLYDSIFGLPNEKSDMFYTIEKSQVVPVLFNEVYLAQVSFHIDHQIDEYERTVQNIFEVVGTIGGNYEILRIIFGLFLGIYTDNMFIRNISNKYKVGACQTAKIYIFSMKSFSCIFDIKIYENMSPILS